MSKRKYDNDEPRVEGEWDAEVKIRQHRDKTHKGMCRKVKTKGVVEISLNSVACYTDMITRCLREGNEVHLADENDNPIIRLFPCMNTDFSEMYVSAQTLGDFRHKTLEGIKWHTTYHGKERDNDEVRKMNKNERSINNERKFIEVTPDMIIKCPKCGTDIRVGRALAKKGV